MNLLGRVGAKQRAMATMTSDLWRAGTAAFLAGVAAGPLEEVLVVDLAGALAMRPWRMATLLHLQWCVKHSLHNQLLLPLSMYDASPMCASHQ